MKRQYDRYQDEGRRTPRGGDDDSGRSAPAHDQVRGRYLRQGSRPDPVHWQPDSHFPGSDPADPGYSSPGVGNHRGRGPRGYVRTDDRVFEDVCERLSEDPMVDASDIEVRCKDGQVALTGSVAGRWMKHRAEDIADSVSGVQDIDNRIRVARGDARRGAHGDTADEGVPPRQPD